ncbi:MAG: phage tail assembly chaperone [Catonella sp.]
MRQTEPKVEKINGIEFYITPFGAFKAANLSGELASMLAPFISVLLPLVNEDTDLMNVDANKVVGSISGNSLIDGNKLENIISKLILGGHIVVNTNEELGIDEPEKLDKDLADEIFCGNVEDMFILCFYVIRLNFNGFFKKLASQSGNIKHGSAGIVRKIF